MGTEVNDVNGAAAGNGANSGDNAARVAMMADALQAVFPLYDNNGKTPGVLDQSELLFASVDSSVAPVVNQAAELFLDNIHSAAMMAREGDLSPAGLNSKGMDVLNETFWRDSASDGVSRKDLSVIEMVGSTEKSINFLDQMRTAEIISGSFSGASAIGQTIAAGLFMSTPTGFSQIAGATSIVTAGVYGVSAIDNLFYSKTPIAALIMIQQNQEISSWNMSALQDPPQE